MLDLPYKDFKLVKPMLTGRPVTVGESIVNVDGKQKVFKVKSITCSYKDEQDNCLYTIQTLVHLHGKCI